MSSSLLLVRPGSVPRTATSRAPCVCFAHQSAGRSLKDGTRRTCTTPSTCSFTESGTTALGSAFGSREHINVRAWESVRACDEMRSAIVSVDHAPAEMVLTRQCADVSKLMYHMRINGDLLDQDLLAAFDGQMRASVSASLSGDLPDHSWWQATTGVTCGGLGPRTALGAALPASLPAASCVASWCPPWSTTSALLLAPRASPSWPSMMRAPTQPLRALSQHSRRTQHLLGQLDEALAERELLWHTVLSGTENAMQDLLSPSLRHARGITPDDGDGDDEHPPARKRPKIQALIIACVDTGVHQELLQMHENEGPWEAHARLLELGDAEVDHTWMWRLNPHHGDVMEPEESVDSVRLRLGCAGPCEPVPCAACPCQSGSLDTGATHATCCAWAKPHAATTRSLHLCTRRLSPAIAPLRPRFPASFLAPISDPPTSSPPPLGTPTPPSTSRSALRTPTRPGRSQTRPLFSARTFLTRRSSGAPTGDLTETR